MTCEQEDKLSSGYLNTVSALYEEMKRMEERFRSDAARLEEFYDDIIDGRKEVYDSAKKMFEAEPSKGNSLRLKWAGAMCAMAAAAKAGCTGLATRKAVLEIMRWEFGMDSEAALAALDAASCTGVIKDEGGAYRLK
ncbi:MAG: hypothetical protein QXU82_02490 [Candidatus Aenigmatarchaeota archaeon]